MPVILFFQEDNKENKDESFITSAALAWDSFKAKEPEQAQTSVQTACCNNPESLSHWAWEKAGIRDEAIQTGETAVDFRRDEGSGRF